MLPAQTIRSGTKIHTLAATGTFKGFKPETEQKVRKPEIKRDLKLEAIIGKWKGFLKEFSILDGTLVGAYQKAGMMLKDILVTKNDVEAFSIVLADFQDEENFRQKAGLFLSAMVNNAQGNGFIIHTKHLSRKIDMLGYNCVKEVRVDGDIGDFVGYANAGGIITIAGDTGRSAGFSMTSGIIRIMGQVGDEAGWGMKGGELHIGPMPYGRRRILHKCFVHGRIYSEGKLVCEK